MTELRRELARELDLELDEEDGAEAGLVLDCTGAKGKSSSLSGERKIV